MHISVLFPETVDALSVRRGGTYIDGTLGRAGHASEILRRAGPEGTLLGIDRDGEALARAEAAMAAIPGRKIFAHAEHGEMVRVAREEGLNAVDGVLLDLGVSSDQLDTPERGFSFQTDGPLDMRMDSSRGKTAADLVATCSAEELTALFREWGEEPRAWQAAQAIVRARVKKAITTTAQLAEIVSQAVGGRAGKRHPATRVFQALRMEVNDEMGNLKRALDGALGLLSPGGRLAVITFESLTDRVVKQFFAEHAGRWVSLQQGGERWEGSEPVVRKVTRHPVVASEEELKKNPRARSAKLRVVERCEMQDVRR